MLKNLYIIHSVLLTLKLLSNCWFDKTIPSRCDRIKIILVYWQIIGLLWHHFIFIIIHHLEQFEHNYSFSDKHKQCPRSCSQYLGFFKNSLANFSNMHMHNHLNFSRKCGMVYKKHFCKINILKNLDKFLFLLL